ncbi:bifunctional N(6)-L-threonylcarbamoyladenine synthase/serine/threonine protein kinase [Halovenus sp. WSH3]|uniref:Probable bifunctional tRNA threonylcarbamoyladenosine biosynthesis protein n=1 Tax=Halovenus carboxidivorans TaxID=2692199 RepID=A0A6B0SXL5_9EURY|nr:bifunctional N(6)-L-threonylcarbamoyladenine synthase/serine/threonine protein kinase [Halovenus carboxidivorans]MXR50274.1 bifunctional N(6)-L-threonylcarbamoyladenine synthase/serine/threonine protein kinase [Halovenus carboxidivorans]
METDSDVRVLGIEGTAWAASAAVYDSASDSVEIETEAYLPDSGGLHPREAAEHMADHLPEVIERIIEYAREEYGPEPFDCVAFSRGPGLGPCLRLVGTSARAVAQRFDLPLVGVNHMVAHLEIGRHFAGFDAPVCLNASGANAHLLGYRAGRYRVLGETMDTGVGNAIDKFTRHVGWSHPGGPKVEEAAEDGEYVELPYVVKGMDFSFSGIMSAAKQEYDDGTPVEDVCCGLQETIFAMLTEVSERALALTGSEELVLGGGVGQNERLREMLTSMCEQRGASFFVPENRFLRDNAGMIAVLGAKMFRAGQTVPVAESGIDSNFRPDEVEVTWRPPEATVTREREEFVQGAESAVTLGDSVEKHRHSRAYRHPELDERLRRERTRQEARLLHEARRQGVSTPLVRDIDTSEMRLTLQHVGRCDLQDDLTSERVETVAEQLARLHEAGLVHGDPTPRNVRVGDRVSLIDFGLGYDSNDPEDHAMDLHVLLGSLESTDGDGERLGEAAVEAYRRVGDEAVLEQLREIAGRGRYQ